MDDHMTLLHDHFLFQGAEELLHEAQSLGVSRFSRGDTICDPATAGRALGIVLEGRAEAVAPTREKAVLAVFGPGGTFGAAALFGGDGYVSPDLRTVIDIGGQDAKIISLTPDGRMSNFIMNDKCAAGTGRFLEVMANILRLDIDDLGAIAAESDSPAAISSTCTVFAESEVISQLANGVKRPDLVAGICQSVATRVASLARRAGIVERVCMSGGVARNEAVRRYMAQALDVEISYDPLAQYFGAIGAALYAWKQASK